MAWRHAARRAEPLPTMMGDPAKKKRILVRCPPEQTTVEPSQVAPIVTLCAAGTRAHPLLAVQALHCCSPRSIRYQDKRSPGESKTQPLEQGNTLLKQRVMVSEVWGLLSSPAIALSPERTNAGQHHWDPQFGHTKILLFPRATVMKPAMHSYSISLSAAGGIHIACDRG